MSFWKQGIKGLIVLDHLFFFFNLSMCFFLSKFSYLLAEQIFLDLVKITS